MCLAAAFSSRISSAGLAASTSAAFISISARRNGMAVCIANIISSKPTGVARASVTVPVITELPKFEISIYHSRTFHHWRLLLFLKHAIRNFWTFASAVELAT